MTLESLRDLSDAALVRRSAGGDEDAFRVLFERKHRRVYLIAYQILGDRGAAEDVAQEAFLSLWEHASRYRPRFKVDTWLRRIATNKAIDRYRSEKRHPDPLGSGDGGYGEDGGFDPTALLEAVGRAGDASLRARWREIQTLWNELAEGLPPQQRAAFVLREIEGLPAREVASTLGCSASAVRTHVSLARKKLRAALADRWPELLAGAAHPAFTTDS